MIRLCIFKRLDGNFRESLQMLGVVRCSYFDVGNNVQNNIPKYIDQVLDGHVIQMLTKIDELLGQTTVQIRANVTSVVSIQTRDNCLSADSPRTHVCLQ